MTDQILTPRQREVITMVANGYTQAQIGRELHISKRTVYYYVTEARERIAQRLERVIPNTIAMVALAVKLGEIEVG